MTALTCAGKKKEEKKRNQREEKENQHYCQKAFPSAFLFLVEKKADGSKHFFTARDEYAAF